MRAFCAWIAIVPVWQCLAAECSDGVGSCTAKQASLMQLKSSNLKKQGLALDTEGSFSSKLAGFQKFTDEMVAKYGASSAEPPSQKVLDAVATVLVFIDELTGHLHKAHDDDVELAAGCSGKIQNCFDSYMSSDIIGEIIGFKNASDTMEQNHETCRTEAQTPCNGLCAPNGQCDKYDTFRGESGGGDVPSLPGCVADGHLNNDYIKADETTVEGKAKLEQMETCLEKMKTWLDGATEVEVPDDGLYENYALCSRVSTDCEADVANCDTQQGEFQAARCLYALESNLRCGAFRSCYSSEVSACSTDCAQIEIRAAAREADNETGQRLVCLLHTLFGERDPDNTTGTGFFARAADADRPGELQKCKEATLLTKDWTIECPAADADGNSGTAPPDTPTIEGYECPPVETPVTSPCSSDFTDGWTTSIYGKEEPWKTTSPQTYYDCSATAQRGLNGIALPCSDAGACIATHKNTDISDHDQWKNHAEDSHITKWKESNN